MKRFLALAILGLTCSAVSFADAGSAACAGATAARNNAVATTMKPLR